MEGNYWSDSTGRSACNYRTRSNVWCVLLTKRSTAKKAEVGRLSTFDAVGVARYYLVRDWTVQKRKRHHRRLKDEVVLLLEW